MLFRSYYITVENPQHVEKGVKTLSFNGAVLAGSLLPLLSEGKEAQVTVTMG